jgi:hypothetical protein
MTCSLDYSVLWFIRFKGYFSPQVVMNQVSVKTRTCKTGTWGTLHLGAGVKLAIEKRFSQHKMIFPESSRAI